MIYFAPLSNSVGVFIHFGREGFVMILIHYSSVNVVVLLSIWGGGGFQLIYLKIQSVIVWCLYCSCGEVFLMIVFNSDGLFIHFAGSNL
jgi:hypothetical protein